MNKEVIATSICQTLQSAGFEAVFAGGCVRDRLQEVEPHDFDIATSATPKQVQNLFPKTLAIGAHFGVILVLIDDQPFEVATFRSESDYADGRHPSKVEFATLQKDAERRDFTVNGLFWDPIAKKLYDFVGGEQDLQKKIIRSIGDATTRYQEDHLRLLRAIRFAVKLGFEIEENTFKAIEPLHASLNRVSRERVRDEFSKILTSPDPERGIRLLDETKLLFTFLPEFDLLKGVEQPMEYHPEGDVFIHTLLLMKGLKNAPVELALGALLHDIAKPQTFVKAPDRIRFHGHDTLGAEMSAEICKRLTYSNAQTELVCALVEHHLRFKDAKNMRLSTLKRFLSLDRFDLHLELHRLDCLASHGNLDAYRLCQEKWEEFKKLPPPPTRILTGYDLMNLGFRSGPELGSILRQIEDAFLEGEFRTKEEAIEWVKKNNVKKQS